MVRKRGISFCISSVFSLDHLIKKLEELERTARLYRGLIRHTRYILRGVYDLGNIHRSFGDAFANIGAREPQVRASEAFTIFGDVHRQTDRYTTVLFETVRPVCK